MKRALLLAVVLAGLLVGTAQAANSYEIVIPRNEAREMVRESGGFVHSCKRLAPRHFRCRATYWSVRHEAEEVEPGVLVEIAREPEPEELTVDVGMQGVWVSG